jgi:acetylornithine deacetylase
MEPTPTESTKNWLSRWLMCLCALDTTSGQEDRGLPALRDLLEELGADILQQPVAEGRTNVFATWGEPRIVFSTHLDTVPPFIPVRKEGETFFGRGVCDAKGQAIAQLAAIRQLLAEGRRDFGWLGVVGEETDSAGATAAMGLKPRFANCHALICGEPTSLKLATGQRGVQHYVLRCRGRAAHSSTPEHGSSALWPMLDWLQALRQMPEPVDPELGAQIWNLGVLDGGDAPNVIPDFAQAHVHARVLPGSDLESRIRQLRPPQGSVELKLSEPPDRYPRIPGFEHAAMPFGSDTPQLRVLVPDRTAVLAGPGSILVAHGPDECISLAELEAGVDLNRRLALHFMDQPGICAIPSGERKAKR